MSSNYKTITRSDLAVPQPVFALLLGLLLGCMLFAYSNLGAAAERSGATQDSITTRPTVNRFDFAGDGLRELLRDPSLTPIQRAPYGTGISELRKPSGRPRTLTDSSGRSRELRPLDHANIPDTRGARIQPPTAKNSAYSKAPNVAGWKKVPTVRTFEVSPNSRIKSTRLPPSRNWTPNPPSQRSEDPSTDRTEPARPASSQRKKRTKRTKRAISRQKKKQQQPRPTNWQNDVLFDD